MSVLVLIPARMASTRLPGKPMADLCGRPMIVHVADRARASGIGRVIVATDTREIVEAATRFGHEAVLTNPAHESGSDRIFEALTTIDPSGAMKIVINLQGDLPTIAPEMLN